MFWSIVITILLVSFSVGIPLLLIVSTIFECWGETPQKCPHCKSTNVTENEEEASIDRLKRSGRW